MKYIPITVPNNPYYTINGDTTTLNLRLSALGLELGYPLNEISYFNLLLGYGAPTWVNVDLFEYMGKDNIDKLREPNTILMFDCTFEGYSHLQIPIIQTLEYSCAKNSINPKKIFLFTGNLKEFDFAINVVPVYILDASSRWWDNNIRTLSESKKLCEQNYTKPVLSLSRRNRPHRIMAHFMLYNSPLFNDCIVSQDRVDAIDPFHGFVYEKMELTPADYIEFSKQLPFIADKDKFDINEPFHALPELHSKTVFSIVNETLADNVMDTSLFFSEKFLKPILNFQPFVIYGQPGVNKKLTMLGYKTYESYFNLDFDDEEDDVIRYKKLLVSVADTVNYLKTMSRAEQINWRYKEWMLLEHNYRQFLKMEHSKNQYLKFVELIKTHIIQGSHQ